GGQPEAEARPERAQQSPDAEVHAAGDAAAYEPVRPTETVADEPVRPIESVADESVRPTRVFVVTGGDDAPGKSTVAINLAHAFAKFGRAAIFDADPSVPNARYFLGLPSWNYLSPMTGDGNPAPNALSEAGVIIRDWSGSAAGDGDELAAGDVIHTDVPESGREPLDFAVVDAPITRSRLLARLAGRSTVYVVVARPNRSGFENTFAALRALKTECGADSAAIVVNGASSEGSAEVFFAKIRTAAERLLSMTVEFVGAVAGETGLGAEQRERGAIVTARPDATVALALRQVATRTLEMTGDGGPRGATIAPGGRTED
ncbi:MAG TPA: hypothetical protein VE960_00165, partial [bacterium]|nr:hypothetical protein [bacterium]